MEGKKPTGFRPRKVQIKVDLQKGPAPNPAELQQDMTAVVVQDFKGEEAGPGFFVQKKAAVAPPVVPPVVPPAALPRAPVPKPTAPKPRIEQRPALKEDVVVPQVQAQVQTQAQAVKPKKTKEFASVDGDLRTYQDEIQSSLKENPYKDNGVKPYVPEDRKGFYKFITTEFLPYQLPVQLRDEINPNACKTASSLQTYKYQQFVRDYMRQASPYRGVLVYHGLGSGKTCTSIAAAEALYSQSDKKIIVMTPKALKENFIDQLMFCGFNHYRLENVWHSFPVKAIDDITYTYARSVMGIGYDYLKRVLAKPEAQRVLWVPELDAEKTPEALRANPYYFDRLESWAQTAIREQIRSQIHERIKFIGYTGFTTEDLRQIVSNKEKLAEFDNAVIIIDEVHNLTRLMAGKLEKYLIQQEVKAKGKPAGLAAAARQRKAASYEPVGVDRWEPKLKGDQTYERAYMFYRLLTGVKNTKIVALSGTPIVNKPVEFGILANILHGYMNSFTITLDINSDDKRAQTVEILENHPRANFFDVKLSQGKSILFCTILEEGYMKVFGKDTGALKGVMQVAPSTKPETIQELFEELKLELAAKGIRTSGEPRYEALPILPPTEPEFSNRFINEKSLEVKNADVFVKRIAGLVSYYKGSKKELMPEVKKDEVVLCTMSKLQLAEYTKNRTGEISTELKKSKQPTLKDAYALDEKAASSYRFRSRASCNFVFPIDIERPFPTTKKDLEKALAKIETTLAADGQDITEQSVEEVQEDEVAEEVAEREDAEEGEEGAATVDAALEGLPKPSAIKRINKANLPAQLRIKTYEERKTEALATLNAKKALLFKNDPAAPENERLATYSPKFAAILERTMASAGTSLVYSAFKTLEGIGIFGMVLEANGYHRLQLDENEMDPGLHPDTIKSFLENPDQPRYILYSGDQRIRARQILINIFNNRLGKLPSKIADILRQSKLADGKSLVDTDNRRGEMCRVFMITGAGAEGLSLRNVRTVHIMEPYWNKVRTDQVKGRAVRICSHQDLPLEERNVEVYTYLAVFGEDAIVDQTIINHDERKTSDEYVQTVANMKEKVSSDVLRWVKAGAVDCQLNHAENEKDIKCYVLEGGVDDFLYDPRLEEDTARTEQMVRIREAPAEEAAAAPQETVKVVMINKLRYLLVENSQTGQKLLYRKSNPNADDVIPQNLEKEPFAELVVNPATGKPELKLM
jgi:hypothetical protein